MGHSHTDHVQELSQALNRRHHNPDPSVLRGINFFENSTQTKSEKIERPELPIDEFIPEIIRTVEKNPVTIVVAETGAGKSTRLPQALLHHGYNSAVTQPRRLAARAVAQRTAYEIGEELGKRVGYETALDGCLSKETELLYCTDGLALVRQVHGDKSRANTILVIDEVHEFNLNIEVLLAWSKEQLRRDPNFKVVIMSATLDKDRLSAYYGNAPVIQVPGRQFPIQELPAGRSIEEDAIDHLSKGQNVLIFVPGVGEIKEIITTLSEKGVNAELLPLHADLLPEEQSVCFKKYNKPKCIVATNVAQTSVTIPDIDVVLDSGLERTKDIIHGVEGLYVRPISLADRAQRKGRAGRTKEGFYRDYCPQEKDRRLAYPIPEIERSHLDQTVLRLAKQGYEMEKLSFFHQPDRSRIRDAKQTLIALGCMTEQGVVTELGSKIAELPVSSRVGKMLLEAHKRGVSREMIGISALIETGGILNRRESDLANDYRHDNDSDLIAELKLFYKGVSIVSQFEVPLLERKSMLEEIGIVPRAFFKALEAYHHITDMFNGTIGEPSSNGSKENLVASIVSGYADQIYTYDKKRRGYSRIGQPQDKRVLSRNSVLSYPPPEIIVGNPFDLDVGGRVIHFVESATRVNSELARSLMPDREAARKYKKCNIETRRYNKRGVWRRAA